MREDNELDLRYWEDRNSAFSGTSYWYFYRGAPVSDMALPFKQFSAAPPTASASPRAGVP